MFTMVTTTAAAINLDYRPASYFWPHGLATHLLARVKGAERKAALRALIDAGRIDEVPELLAKSALSDAERQAIGRIHPALMGGEYLPNLHDTEIEIARISIQSVTSDVTSVYARRGEGCIHYRVVDEYEGDTLSGERERTTTQPLTLGELVDYFTSTWPFIDVLRMNYEDDLEGMLGFFSGDSAFYAKFDNLLRERVREACDSESDE
jgi:hypothetical protein